MQYFAKYATENANEMQFFANMPKNLQTKNNIVWKKTININFKENSYLFVFF